MRYNIKNNVVEQLLEKKHVTKRDISIMMGYNEKWLSNIISKHSQVTVKQVKQLSMLLGCNEEELIDVNYDVLNPSQFEIDVLELLNKVLKKVEENNRILIMMHNEKPQGKKPESIDELETAMKVLKDLLANRQAIKRDIYMAEARKAGVTNDKISDAAIAKLGHHKKTTGYGNNKAVWIYKSVTI